MIQIDDGEMPIMVANKLITATQKMNILGYEKEINAFSDEDLKQIAWHLLIHIGEIGGEEE